MLYYVMLLVRVGKGRVSLNNGMSCKISLLYYTRYHSNMLPIDFGCHIQSQHYSWKFPLCACVRVYSSHH